MTETISLPTDRRVLNLTRNFRLKRNQALKAVENCACAWVDYGVSIRDLTLAESIAARNQQASTREPLPLSELRGVVYQPPIGKSLRPFQALAWQADKFAAEHAA